MRILSKGHERLLIGYAAIVPNSFGHDGLFSHHLYLLRVRDSSAISVDFMCHLLNSRAMHEMVSGYATGTTVNMLPVDALTHPPIVIPPVRLVAMFAVVAEAMRVSHDQLLAESQLLSMQRDFLLPRLISGETTGKNKVG